MDFKKLIGLTIEDIILEESTIYDDDPSVIIHADNGARFRIEGGYGEETGESNSKYRTTLTLTGINPATNKDSLVKKKRGVRVQYGNNTREEFKDNAELVARLLKRMNKEELENTLHLVDYNTLSIIERIIKI